MSSFFSTKLSKSKLLFHSSSLFTFSISASKQVTFEDENVKIENHVGRLKRRISIEAVASRFSVFRNNWTLSAFDNTKQVRKSDFKD